MVAKRSEAEWVEALARVMAAAASSAEVEASSAEEAAAEAAAVVPSTQGVASPRSSTSFLR